MYVIGFFYTKSLFKVFKNRRIIKKQFPTQNEVILKQEHDLQIGWKETGMAERRPVWLKGDRYGWKDTGMTGKV